MKNTSLVLAALMSLGLLSCSKEETQSEGGYQIRIGESLAKKGSAIQVNSAIAYLEEVELEREFENDSNEVEIDIEGRFTVDLLTGNSNPAIPSAKIEPGTYHELELEFGDDDRLAFEIEGVYTDTAGNAINFRLSMIQELEFKIEDEDNGIVIPADYFVTLNVNFPVSTALASLDWSSASINANNSIEINQQSNPSLLQAFLSALNLTVDD